jgi:hypothetical protein
MNDLLHIDVLEDAMVFHSVTGSGMKLTRALQGLIIIIMIVAMTSRSFDRVDFMVVFTRPLAPEVVTMVMTSIPSFSTVTIIVMAMVAVINSPTVVTVIISSWRVVTLSSSHVLPDQLLRVVGIDIVLGDGEKLSDYSWPLLK